MLIIVSQYFHFPDSIIFAKYLGNCWGILLILMLSCIKSQDVNCEGGGYQNIIG